MADELALGRAIREAVNGRNVMEFDERASRAVHSFLGVEKGKELQKDAVAMMVAALRVMAGGDADQEYSDAEKRGMAEAALRAAGEEVEGD